MPMAWHLPPFAWSRFSIDHPDEAMVRAGHVGTRNDLEASNARVNRMARQTGKPPADETWLIWPSRAWCHDYAITKRHDLLVKGWPSSALLLALCRTDRGENHMVLIANGWVMDNLRVELLPYTSTGYDWSLPMQTAGDPNVWEAWR